MQDPEAGPVTAPVVAGLEFPPRAVSWGVFQSLSKDEGFEVSSDLSPLEFPMGSLY